MNFKPDESPGNHQNVTFNLLKFKFDLNEESDVTSNITQQTT